MHLVEGWSSFRSPPPHVIVDTPLIAKVFQTR